MHTITHEEKPYCREHSLTDRGGKSQQQNRLADYGAGEGLKLEFQKVQLQTVLDHFNTAAGVIIRAKSNVQTERPVNLCHDAPVTAAKALSLLKQALVEMGCTLVQKGTAFSVIRSQDLKKTCIPLPTIRPKAGVS